MANYSEPWLRKHKKRNGDWVWQAIAIVTDGDKSRQVTKMTNIACDPKKPSEGGSGRHMAASGKGARQATTFLNEWRAELAEKYKDDEVTDTRRDQSVIDFCRDYWKTKTNVSDNTKKEFRKAENHIDHPKLDMSICDLTSEDVQAWLDAKTAQGCGTTALKKAFVQLKAACSWGVRMGYLQKNPCNAITAPKPEPRQKNPLDEDAIDKLNEMLDNLRASSGSMRRCVADAASLALLTGMREGEVCGLAWSDIDGGVDGTMSADGYIHVRQVVTDANGGATLKPYPKSRKYRDIPMNNDIVRMLEARRALFVEMEGNDLSDCYVIARPETARKFMSNGYLCHRWSDFIGMTGIKGMEGLTPVFHDLRHTFATQAIAHDVDIVSVSAIMGHASPTITLNIYARWTKRAKSDAMKKLNGVLG